MLKTEFELTDHAPWYIQLTHQGHNEREEQALIS